MAALFAAADLTMVEVSCNRCERRGRLSIARLLAEHGHALPGPELRRIIAHDCPRMVVGKIPDVCGVHVPQMVALTPEQGCDSDDGRSQVWGRHRRRSRIGPAA